MFGNGAASIEDVRELLGYSLQEWDLDGFRRDDISERDKMNVMAFLRLTNSSVQNALRILDHPQSAAVYHHYGFLFCD